MREMNVDEAQEFLSTTRGRGNDSWGGRHEEHFDHSQFGPGPQRGGYPGIGGPTGNPLATSGFPPGAGPGLLNNMGGAASQGNRLDNFPSLITSVEYGVCIRVSVH